MSTITAEIDGQSFEVDLSKVSALDAISYRHEVGAELDLLIVSWMEQGGIALLADLGIARWLWERQNVDALAPLGLVAKGVTLLPVADVTEV